MAAKPNIEDVLARVAHVEAEDSIDEHRKSDIKALLFGDSAPPRRIGRFIDLGVIGHGAMGTVRRAYDERLAREVAIKVVRHRATPRHDERLLREAQALAQVSHPNVVQIYEVGEVGHEIFIAMDLIEGVSLDKWHSDAHSWRECLDVYLQAGRGLAAAHAVGLVHRDFKPANCIRDTEGRVRVLDFGLARGFDVPEPANDQPPSPPVLADTGTGTATAADTEVSTVAETTMLQVQLTASNAVVGTIAYMAPEQFAGGQVDASSDQFSFCVALFEAMYGEPPFSRDPRRALIRMAGDDPPRLVFPRTSRGVPRGVRAALRRGLRAKPEARWPSMDALLRELERPLRRSRWGQASVLAVVAGASALGGVMAVTESSSLAFSGRDPCSGARGSAEEIWADRRADVRNALSTTKAPYAVDTWMTVDAELETYAKALGDTAVAACRVSLHEDPSGGTRECLEQRRDWFERTIELLSATDGTSVEHAALLVAGLPSISRCVHPDAWRPPLTEPSDQRAQIVKTLDRARILSGAARYEEGLRTVTEARIAAMTSNEPRALAQALVVEGSLFLELGKIRPARARFEAASELALRRGFDEVAIEGLSLLGRLDGVEFGKSEVGLASLRGAVNQAGQAGIDPLKKAHALTLRAQVLTTGWEHVEAEAEYREALDLLESELGPDHLDLVEAIDGLAQVLAAQGDIIQSMELYERSLEIHRRWQGARHPATALTLSDAAAVLKDQGEYTWAQAQAERAIEILQGTLGPDHMKLSRPLNTLAAIFDARKEYTKAEELYRTSIPIAERTLGARHPDIARLRFNLAKSLRKQDKTALALEEYQMVLRILDQGERSPADATLAATTLRRLGKMSTEAGNSTVAAEYYRKGITWLEDHGDAQDPRNTKLRDELEELTLQ